MVLAEKHVCLLTTKEYLYNIFSDEEFLFLMLIFQLEAPILTSLCRNASHALYLHQIKPFILSQRSKNVSADRVYLQQGMKINKSNPTPH
jgi:hypothetical protein